MKKKIPVLAAINSQTLRNGWSKNGQAPALPVVDSGQGRCLLMIVWGWIARPGTLAWVFRRKIA